MIDAPTNDEQALKAAMHLSRQWSLVAFEVLLIWMLFFAYAGWPPPSINEAHYLTKAKHFWNPQWCERDLFLQSRDAHVVFFWTVGWLTKYVSLPATAWIGRFTAWLLLAIGWRKLSTAIAPGPLIPVLTAAWFLVLAEHFHMSGEWVVGGVEGKAFAYAFVWLGMAALVQNRWSRAWIWLGLATAFHALVGGWATAAALITCLTFGESRRQLRQMIPAMLVGLLLAAPSVVAGLSLDRDVAPEMALRAARIMVHSRLSHHLAIHTFSHWFIIRFAALALVWLLLSGYAARQHPPEQRLNRMVAVALGIALLGAIIDQGLLWNLELAARLLKFYWYRLADALLPAGVALTLASAVVRKRQHNPESAGWLLVLLIVIPAFVLGPSIHGRRYDFRPHADRRWDTAITDPARRIERYDNWRKVCRWINDNTPEDALLATPRAQQTFKWYAQRAEVVNWKDIPQDAAHIVEWLDRQRDWFPRRVLYRGITALSDERILELAKQYDVQYLVVERGRMRRPLGPAFQQVYPSGIEENSDFAVMRILDLESHLIDELQTQ